MYFLRFFAFLLSFLFFFLMTESTFSPLIGTSLLLEKAIEKDLKDEEFVNWLSSLPSLLEVPQKLILLKMISLMFLLTASEYDELSELYSMVFEEEAWLSLEIAG